jgi:isopentenyldiphosphate isomerase
MFEKEYLEIYDSYGNRTGKKALKSIIHKKGIYHTTIHLWIYTKKGDVLIQKRSLNKILNPGVWDVSVAGHIHFNESYIDALVRETLEETGIAINITKLSKLGVYKSSTKSGEITDNEFHHTYIIQLGKKYIDLNFKNQEVDELKLISLNEMKSLLKNSKKNFFIGINKKYYKDVIEEITRKTIKNY